MRYLKHTMGILLVLGFSAASVATAQEYRVVLTPPTSVGQKYRLTALGVQKADLSASVGGKVIQQRKVEYSVEFESENTILEVDKKNMPSRLSILVRKCVKIQAGTTKDLLTTGTVVVGYMKEQRELYEKDGQPLPPEAQEALDLVVTLNDGGPTDDEMYGTSEPQKVGGRWKINAEVLAAAFREVGMELAVEDIVGEATLEGVEKIGDTDFLRVKCRMDAKKPTLPVYPGFVVDKEKSLVWMSGSGLYPSNGSFTNFRETGETGLTFVARGAPTPDGVETVMEVTQMRRLQAKYSKIE